MNRLFQVGRGVYDHEILVRKVKDLVQKYDLGDGAEIVTTLADPRGEEACKVFVVAVNRAYTDAQLRLFRTSTLTAGACEIWEVVGATMAVSGNFSSVALPKRSSRVQ